jgi:hypothetical protein
MFAAGGHTLSQSNNQTKAQQHGESTTNDHKQPPSTSLVCLRSAFFVSLTIAKPKSTKPWEVMVV